MKRSHLVNPKRLFTITFLCFALSGIAQVSSQPVQLSVARYSEAPHTDTEHEYLIKATNISLQAVTIKIKTQNTACDQKQTVNLDREVYWTTEGSIGSLSGVTTTYIIPAQGTAEFAVRTKRPLGTPLNTWNCILVEAINVNDQAASNSIVIESFIPDPKDFK